MRVFLLHPRPWCRTWIEWPPSLSRIVHIQYLLLQYQPRVVPSVEESLPDSPDAKRRARDLHRDQKELSSADAQDRKEEDFDFNDVS